MRLYLRSRSVPVTLLVMVGCAAALWGLGHPVDEPHARGMLTLLVVLLAVVSAAPGLAGADLDLDRVSGFAWAPWRAAHLLVAGVVAGALVATVAILDGQPSAAAGIARDTAGLMGLVGIGAATLGASRAPMVPLVWTVVGIGLPATARPLYRVVLSWMVQPTGSHAATITAIALGVSGTVAYAVFGPRRR